VQVINWDGNGERSNFITNCVLWIYEIISFINSSVSNSYKFFCVLDNNKRILLKRKQKDWEISFFPKLSYGCLQCQSLKLSCSYLSFRAKKKNRIIVTELFLQDVLPNIKLSKRSSCFINSNSSNCFSNCSLFGVHLHSI